jgi:NadR type nicotinamide-nucleotide adenylyltransferase
MSHPKKIVVIGPESTGKSTLCEQLAKHYNTVWVKEYAREYLLKNGTSYNYENLLDVAKGQLELEDRDTGNCKSSTIFIDTDMYIMKVWCEFVFNKCHRWILDQIAIRNYDLYLLCNVDVEWVKDELREYPDLKSRQKLYYNYKDIIVNQPIPWVEISGNYEERLQKAIDGVNKLL